MNKTIWPQLLRQLPGLAADYAAGTVFGLCFNDWELFDSVFERIAALYAEVPYAIMSITSADNELDYYTGEFYD